MLERDQFLNRNYNIDFLKVIACIAVIGLHTLQKDISVINSSLYYLCGYAIPIFWMCSGAFAISRHSCSWKYVFNKIVRILRLVVIWNVLIFVAKILANSILHTDFECTIVTIPKDIIGSLIQKGMLWHFWYFGALILLYLLLPIFVNLTNKQKWMVVACSGIIAILLQLYSIIIGEPIQKNVFQTFRLWTWIFYFVLGGLVYHSIQQQKKYLFEKHMTIVLICITGYIILYQNFIGRFIIKESMGVLHAEYFYDSVFTMAQILILFIWANRLHMGVTVKPGAAEEPRHRPWLR